MLKELKEAILTEVKEDITAMIHRTHDNLVWVLVPYTPYNKINFLKSYVMSLHVEHWRGD